MRIALIAHDKKKSELVAFVREHRDYFSTHSLVGTGTTGWLIQEKTGLEIECVKSGPLGGDQQIGGQIAAVLWIWLYFFGIRSLHRRMSLTFPH